MDNEHHIYGPPGTGKTTTVAKNVSKAVAKYGPRSTLVCSFTKAAATELASREVPLDPDKIGTLHSICYRALGMPKIAEANMSHWNEDHPSMQMTGEDRGMDDATPDQFAKTDGVLAQYNLLRAKLTPPDLYPISIKSFIEKWEDWKRQNDYIDFGDMISLGRSEFDIAPGNPTVMFVDEAQDLNAAQFDCIRHWGKNMQRIVFIGDDDQAIYKFTGADARNLIDRDIPDENRIILKKSYRLPVAVHQAAQKWIKKCSHRQEKEFEACDTQGRVDNLFRGNWRAPESIIEDAIAKAEDGLTVMILCTCSYMLKPTIDFLKSNGVAFHNPYRVTRGDWNPIRRKDGSTYSRVVQFIRSSPDGFDPGWTYHNMAQWAGLLPSKGIFKRGAKTRLAELSSIEEIKHQVVPPSDYRTFLEDGPWFGFAPWDCADTAKFLMDNASPSKQAQVDYACKVRERYGPGVLDRVPKITVGTIHSVKGAEADVVYLFPDMSRDATAEWDRGGDSQDAMRRTFYVGMTRAKDSLFIAPPASGMAVRMV